MINDQINITPTSNSIDNAGNIGKEEQSDQTSLGNTVYLSEKFSLSDDDDDDDYSGFCCPCCLPR